MSTRASRLLLVDDDPAAIHVMSRILGQYEQQRFATSGADALRLAREIQPDLIVLDADMPGMNGLEVCTALRKDPALSRVPVICASSHGDPSFELAALKRGATDFVAKPLVASKLQARARAQLRARQVIEDLKLDHRAVFAATHREAARPPRLLIVDDDVVAIRLLQHTLAELGHFHFARTADAALHVAQRVEPDLVLLDLHMPDTDGFELCRKLRAAAGACRHLPIVFVTRFGTPDAELQGLEVGAVDFISKSCRPAVLVARVRNLLAQKLRADAELRAVGERWHRYGGTDVDALVAAVSDAVISVNAAGQVLMANAASARLFGVPDGALIGQPLKLVLGRDLCDVAQPGTANACLQLRRSDGTTLRAELSVAMLAAGPERVTTLVLRDVGAAERLATEVEARTKAEAANRTASLMLSYLAHEIGNPLNGVLGFAQLMAADSRRPLDAVQARRLNLLVASGNHLRMMMRDVQQASSLQVDTLPVNLQAIEARDAVAAAISAVSAQAELDGISVAQAPGSPIWVQADPVRLHQVLLNLLSNAVKYSPGGAVWVEMTGYVDADTDTETVGIAVVDQGMGMTDEQASHLFEPFNRLGRQDGSTSGTGLGLVISRHLVEAMNGHIDVSSRPDQGSRFEVRLPVPKSTTLEPRKTPAADRGAMTGASPWSSLPGGSGR
jgi:PleD family two-component response regulator/signal transduction histidine kinase